MTPDEHFEAAKARERVERVAPALLAALKDMVGAWDMSDDEGEHRRIWDAARAAIAEAEGRP